MTDLYIERPVEPETIPGKQEAAAAARHKKKTASAYRMRRGAGGMR